MKAEPRASAPKPRCAGKAKPQARTGVKKDMKVPTLPPAVKRALAANISENDPALCVEAGPSFGKAIALLTGPKAKPQPWMANFKAYPKDDRGPKGVQERGRVHKVLLFVLKYPSAVPSSSQAPDTWHKAELQV
eukprot:5755549-Amphidinium_carterae.1